MYEQRGGVEGAIKGIFPGVHNCSSPEVQGQCTEVHQLNILFVSNVSSEMGRRTSKITSGFVSVAPISRVKNVTKKGTRDVR